ncbi:MAG: fluoride efflux transporter CrcB [Clostridiales bacterium]|nr:fluoride efflux transporter CrcB [Clostridiales bacterium]
MVNCILVGLGGFIGAVLRYLVNIGFSDIAKDFPIVTMFINFTGAIAIGMVTEFSSKITPIHPNLLLFLTVGIFGGYTTFSTFSLETVNLIEKGKLFLGLEYASVSVLLCVTGVYLGKYAIRFFAGT